MSAQPASERREYIRVATSLRFTLERLEDDEAIRNAIAEILPESPETPADFLESELTPVESYIVERLDQLAGILDNLHRKVDRLLEGKGKEEKPRTPPVTLLLHNVSGGGFSFLTREPPRVGEIHRAEIELSTYPHVLVPCLIEIKWVRRATAREALEAGVESAEAHQVGVEITHIREADRDRIVHTVFRAQREALRARKQAGEQ